MTAYLVLDFSIKDLRGFMPYVEAIPAFIAKHSGRYIVRGVEPEVMEGDWTPERMVILEFPSSDHARAFLNDPEAQDLFALRKHTTVSKLVLVEGDS
ncbi:hypothetical protein ASE17_04155 [Phenylobacterium sp. Root77]|uniref:DUF1330 domain-containing protein n=1 Tax=unclassified Phenylobacterium TaxID=2640670 RepID=UPI0006F893DD|nr:MULTISPECIES: DUF1330 domain-containing protein [unclassified Phenylobacterium]KQW72068.1 hypothetical protein ASC73_08380 [Phenylobacterium sp. Root1277]KQW94988.1 hypothetical protein ASC79_04525 [Phenylobacterium sp. Root1290]KRC44681.1 hypothetical protein ASE17_04155 [Phenylobacterium sp. Root77]